jgi:hypothetical protein
MASYLSPENCVKLLRNRVEMAIQHAEGVRETSRDCVRQGRFLMESPVALQSSQVLH